MVWAWSYQQNYQISENVFLEKFLGKKSSECCPASWTNQIFFQVKLEGLKFLEIFMRIFPGFQVHIWNLYWLVDLASELIFRAWTGIQMLHNQMVKQTCSDFRQVLCTKCLKNLTNLDFRQSITVWFKSSYDFRHCLKFRHFSLFF